MDESYYHYFRDAFESSSDTGPHFTARELKWPPSDRRVVTDEVRNAIRAAGAALEEDGRLLRPDATWFLLLVFSELMAQPVLAVQSGRPEQVLPQLAADVRTVAFAAADLSNEREVSSHVVVDALSQRWDELELTRASWWE